MAERRTSSRSPGSRSAASRTPPGSPTGPRTPSTPPRIAYATRGHLSAEWAVLRSAGERGRTALPRHVVEDWLDAHPAGQALSPAQREALLGLATSDAATAVLVGPAGTGKSFTAAAFDTAWRDLTAQLAEHPNPDVRARYGTGRAVGVAITQAAADVLAEDGVTDSANIAAFLAAQHRLADGRAPRGRRAVAARPERRPARRRGLDGRHRLPQPAAGRRRTPPAPASC